MNKIDTHTHLGTCDFFGASASENQLLESMDAYDIQTSIVQALPGCPNVKQVNDRIANLAREHPGRFYGLASINCNILTNKAYRKEVDRCIEELKFVGIKLHHPGYPVFPGSPRWEMIVMAAVEHNIPLMLHTGAGSFHATPSMALPIIKKFPELRIIITHGGQNVYGGEVISIVNSFDNVYYDVSWCSICDSEWIINSCRIDRALFASDIPANLPMEVRKYELIDLPNDKAKKVFNTNAVTLFNLK